MAAIMSREGSLPKGLSRIAHLIISFTLCLGRIEGSVGQSIALKLVGTVESGNPDSGIFG